MPIVTKAPANVLEILEAVKAKHHPALENARIALGFADTKPFLKGRFNWGKTSKFSKVANAFQDKKYDFCIILCVDVWYSILNDAQREALLDLHLSCCDVEHEPVTQIVNNKKKVVKDEWGRVQYTDEIKYDEDGNPKWKVNPLDLETFAANVRRYGLWCDQFDVLREAVKGAS